jgi:hypothetical protein
MTANKLDQTDPAVSAVVELRPRDELEESESDPEAYQRATSKIKAHFTSAGFEVHAPFTTSFSIGGKVSLFESYFGTRVVFESEGLGTSITVEGGETELSLDSIPEDVSGIVKSVHFMPPPDFVPR